MKTDPKCWLCGVFTSPPEPVQYQPLICVSCLSEYKERKFKFVRASQQEIDELFPTLRNIEITKGNNGSRDN